MRTAFIAAVLLSTLAAVHCGDEDKKTPLLGADDVDKKHAESEVVSPKELKEKLKTDKQSVKVMKTELQDLKIRLKQTGLPKKDKKELRKEFNNLKSTLGAKKTEVTREKSDYVHARAEKMAAKKAKMSKKMGKKHDKKGKGRKHGDSDIVMMEPQVDQTPVQMNKSPKKHGRKEARKTHKRKGKKEAMTSGGGRVRCETDDDCPGAVVCHANKKGHKFCKGGAMDKGVGHKCHKSEQCGNGLKCFVLNEQQGGRKKGHCIAEENADLTKGAFVPYGM